ncbi:hypothetical protein [Circovirus-like genome DCCV-11]|uniref:hypothetical protein n=1 Tax=Circovirus-like genome DCCV-11 TaxID=1788439 RepID=UPI0007F9D4D0|nr:hypothetical protein [Circovirus-like genome DCCV-11]AMB42986.1 hypothetical protein [Circovirus-like genome DCCV-11]
MCKGVNNFLQVGKQNSVDTHSKKHMLEHGESKHGTEVFPVNILQSDVSSQRRVETGVGISLIIKRLDTLERSVSYLVELSQKLYEEDSYSSDEDSDFQESK